MWRDERLSGVCVFHAEYGKRPTIDLPKKRQTSTSDAYRMIRIVECDSQSVSENRSGLLEGYFVLLEVFRRLPWIPTELHARIIKEAPCERLTPGAEGRRPKARGNPSAQRWAYAGTHSWAAPAPGSLWPPISEELLNHTVELRAPDASIYEVLSRFDQHAQGDNSPNAALKICSQSLVVAWKEVTFGRLFAATARAFHVASFTVTPNVLFCGGPRLRLNRHRAGGPSAATKGWASFLQQAFLVHSFFQTW